MNEELKKRIVEWLRHTPSVRGALVRSIRFADETFVSDSTSPDFPAGALEQAWRSVTDTFQVLAAQRLSATRLTWVYERAILHCARREDGAIFGVFVSRREANADEVGLNRLMSEFLGFAGK